MRFFALVAAAAAALAYFFDPRSGKGRRKQTADRIGGFFRRTGKRAGRTGRAVAAETRGVAKKATHMREQEKPQPNDAALAEKVQSEVFRDAEVPKGKINVNAEDGVVYLRGELDSQELIDRLVTATRDVQGVRGVESLLHVPGARASGS